MKKAHASAHMLISMDGIAQPLNIRGDDIRHSSVVLSYVVVTMGQLYLFVNREVLGHRAYPYMDNGEDITTRQYPGDIGATVLLYDQLYDIMEGSRNEKVLLEENRVNYVIYRLLNSFNKIIDRMNPTALMKSIRNDVEIENEGSAHIKDGVAMTKFIYWLKKNIGRIPMDEINVSDYLRKPQTKQEGCIGPNFSTMSAYGEHGTMCRYSATEETNTPLEPKELYLVDSDGQYYEGTTDITRIITLGSVIDEEKEYLTLVFMGMPRLGAAKFLHGCRELSIDYVTREPSWSGELNFEHGMGHDASYSSNYHERPNGIRSRTVPERQDNRVLKPGTVTSNEPGFYIEGNRGIRTKNLTVCVKDEKNEYGQFLKSESLTFAPIDLEVVDKVLMTKRDVELLNEYHRQVHEKIGLHLNEDEGAWLRDMTAAIQGGGYKENR